MEIKNLIVLFALLVMFVALLLFGQWQYAEKADGGLQDQGEYGEGPVSLSVRIWNDDEIISRQIFQDYMQANPHTGISVTVSNVRAYHDELRLAFAAGEQIDVFNVDKAEHLTPLIEEGYLLPLDELISREKFDTSIYSTQFDSVKYGNTAYALPYRLSVFCIAYNKSMFRERGVPFPTDDMTWDQLRELAERMTFARDGEQVFGFYLCNRTFDNYFMALQNGKTLVDDDLSLFQRSLAYKVDLIENGICIRHEDYVDEERFIRQDFENERMAMYLTADWTINQMRESYANGTIRFEFDVAALPSVDGSVAGRSFGQQSYVAVAANSPQQSQAFRLASYYAGIPGAMRFAQGGVLPAVIGDDEVIAAFLGDGRQAPTNIRAFVDQTIYIMMPVIPGIDTLNGIFNEEAAMACMGEKTVEEAMASVEARRRKAMQQLTTSF